MKLAVEYVRRMRGGAQAHLLKCDDGAHYIVKFQNNPQHLRILANEMLATRLAARLGLCVPQVEVVNVRPDLIACSSEMVIELGSGRKPCSAGNQFGSKFPRHFGQIMIHEALPYEKIFSVRNISDFLGIYVFDKWTCNTDRRQAIFFGESRRRRIGSGDAFEKDQYRVMMIDQGACFNAGEWNFPDAPLHGIYEDKRVYRNVEGMNAFETWIGRLENRITEEVLKSEARRIPSEWYSGNQAELERLLSRLYDRRTHVRELIDIAHRSNRNPFTNWKVPYYSARATEPSRPQNLSSFDCPIYNGRPAVVDRGESDAIAASEL